MKCHVRLAERSKAPDSSLKGFPLRSILVHECGRGFESHIWQRFSISREHILYNLDWLEKPWGLCVTLPSSTNEFICVTKWLGRRFPFAHPTSKWDDFIASFWKPMEDRGIDPRASRMRIERSTTWARPPHIMRDLFFISLATIQFFRTGSGSDRWLQQGK